MMLDKQSGIPFAVCLVAFSHSGPFFLDLVDADPIEFVPQRLKETSQGHQVNS